MEVPERKHTNRNVLAKGIKYLAGSLPLAFMGPTILYSAFHNQEHPLYVVVLIAGILICAGSVFCMFKGILTMVKAIFD